ncbi:shikimate kinase 3, chloroplastic-like isoform X2 [Prosopis cineraria]|uniref:shikimate kinase 3, chloroplastic-like isoform X2 n=1 Tax=Prosopis cineraria TaxID=364024 RepID=UPI00240EC038|nr:shikimate kinase 3, chloroplastic-like isoform X2 [Prosopis cineraria]
MGLMRPSVKMMQIICPMAKLHPKEIQNNSVLLLSTMGTICGQSLQYCTWLGSNSLLPVSKTTNLCDYLQWKQTSKSWEAKCLEISHSNKSSQAPNLEPRNCDACFDENWLLKTKGQEVSSHLNGRSIYLVGMMGSGKTTVGRILSEALNYSFVDSDHFVEEFMGGISVARIFNEYGESFFRDNESEALKKLSLMSCKVVATGGGAVVRPVNWEYFKQGISVYLNVPLDALAKRIAAVGTSSRPLLDSSGDAYTKAFVGLFPISKKRADAYANADIKVSLLDLAANLGDEDVLNIAPAAIAAEVLLQIEKFLGGATSTSVH